ncbi:Gfo/Idh/MocA family oxidoreductase [Niabella pedocola]|uniref:Gfo/Idh/MocA family oxidoreductase n=1 Tax=Niabella pedocola TaxID=1752077 RepID=A0ABS8PPM9_9BACT|nr:Gfo/Idh/MocA family oxidoreductase [Niabella pedocola]MCD2423050.1 Gfo/Idh/MocA family oxidoreductase [Niabella pedocola]
MAIIKEEPDMNDYAIDICMIGAGGIVNDAHLPAYRMAGFSVKGIVDRNRQRAREIADKFAIPQVYDSLEAMVADRSENVIYDCALPASEIIGVLRQLPEEATVLIQKPLGESIEEARTILEIAHSKNIRAGVNFQLRFAPFIQEAKKMIGNGQLGTLTDIEIYVNVHTPWNRWSFLFEKPRMEINYHSIHYIDLVRSFLGNPSGVYAKTYKHPDSLQLASVKSSIIMDYGDLIRATIHTNHHHNFGYQHQEAYIKIEGTSGAVKMNLGVLINYPTGIPDTFEYITTAAGEVPEWRSKKIAGSWFPHAFMGTMEQMILAKKGFIAEPENNIDDAFDTMRCVEAAYLSSAQGGVQLPPV